jgi:hypothetical protein
MTTTANDAQAQSAAPPEWFAALARKHDMGASERPTNDPDAYWGRFNALLAIHRIATGWEVNGCKAPSLTRALEQAKAAQLSRRIGRRARHLCQSCGFNQGEAPTRSDVLLEMALDQFLRASITADLADAQGEPLL